MLISLILTLVVLGVVLYLVNTVIPMPQWLKVVVNALVGIWVLFYVLGMLGGHPVYVR